MKNWNAIMFRNILKHITAQSFLVDGFYEHSKYLKSFSIHLYKPTQEIHDNKVPKIRLLVNNNCYPGNSLETDRMLTINLAM